MGELGKPKLAHAIEDHTLLGDGFGHHYIEGREPIAGDHQQLVIAHRIEITNLAATNQRQ